MFRMYLALECIYLSFYIAYVLVLVIALLFAGDKESGVSLRAG